MIKLTLIFLVMMGNFKIVKTAVMREIPLDTLIMELAEYDVIFFGEKHDSPVSHKFELELLKGLLAKYKVVLSLEMFERDIQKWIDEYLQGNINEEEFLSKSRPWPNYKSDYRPLIEYAKVNHIPVVASNIPRWIANKVAKNGIDVLDTLNVDKNWFSKKIFPDNQEYRKRFYETMAHIHMPGMKKESMENFYWAQCLKDATMAESIAMARNEYKDVKIIHMVGSFHCDYHLGTVYHLLKISPELKMCVITTASKAKKEIGEYLVIDAE